MNKDNAAEYLPLVQALADGKTIQVADGKGGFDSLPDPKFRCESTEYRIKPEPFECWVNIYEGNYNCYHNSKYNAEKGFSHGDNSRCAVHMREVEE